MRYQYVQGRRQLVTTERTTTTNDIWGVPAVRPAAGAVLRVGDPSNRKSVRRGLGRSLGVRATTYYPGTANIGEAQRVTIELAQTKAGIDLVLTDPAGADCGNGCGLSRQADYQRHDHHWPRLVAWGFPESPGGSFGRTAASRFQRRARGIHHPRPREQRRRATSSADRRSRFGERHGCRRRHQRTAAGGAEAVHRDRARRVAGSHARRDPTGDDSIRRAAPVRPRPLAAEAWAA